jgi:hypothetical protein
MNTITVSPRTRPSLIIGEYQQEIFGPVKDSDGKTVTCPKCDRPANAWVRFRQADIFAVRDTKVDVVCSMKFECQKCKLEFEHETIIITLPDQTEV